MPKREWPGAPEGAMLLSQSTVGSLELSPCRVISVPKGLRPLTSEAMFSGTVQHMVVEDIVLGVADHLKAISVRNIISIAEHCLQDEPWPGTLADLVGDPVGWATQLSILTEAWWQGPYATLIRQMDLLEAEVPRWKAHPYGRLPYSDRELVIVTGGIDYIGRHPERGIIAVDWKTSGRQWYQNAGGGRIQHQLYDFLIDDEYEVDEWLYIIGDRSKMEWGERSARVTARSKAAALDRAWQWAVYLDDPDRPYLCTPSEGKTRGWWAKPAFNHGWCMSCRFLGDEWDERWDGVPAVAVDENGEVITVQQDDLVNYRR